MVQKLIKFGFVAGELSPTFVNRGDLEKYDLALAKAQNWFVDYRGGLVSRPGTQFCEYFRDDDKEIVLVPFQYNYSIPNTYLVVFGHNYVRFVQEGSYVLESLKTVTAVTLATQGVVTSVTHGYLDGDWVKFTQAPGMPELLTRTLVVANKTVDTFKIKDALTGAYINTTALGTWSTGGTRRIYTLVSDYASHDLASLSFSQIRDTIRITSADFPTFDLTRTNSTSWALAATDLDNSVSAPVNVDGVGSNSGESQVIFAVTAVIDDEESIASSYFYLDSIIDYSNNVGNAKVVWDPVPGAHHYNIYRSIITSNNALLSRATQLGYLGRAYGPTFVDNNIIPDFTKTPPINANPFAPSQIKNIDVTAGGSGYLVSSDLTLTDVDGSGFVGYPVTMVETYGGYTAGEVLSVVIVSPGINYAAPTVNLSDGTGATFDVELGPATGTYPRISAVFQQRQIYAASDNDPITVWGSRPGLFNNFGVSDITLDNDAYDFELDTQVVEPIKHLIATRAGLLMLTRAGMWQLVGTGGGPVTPTDALAERQSYNGVSNMRPIQINEDILLVDSDASAARMLTYSDFSKTYAGKDVSIISNHLFTAEDELESWVYLNSPAKIVLAQRSAGSILAFTVVKEQEVFSWTPWSTQGYFQQIASLREENTDVAYVVVQRLIGGTYYKYLERFAARDFVSVETAWCVDAALSLPYVQPAADLTASGLTGTITLTATAGVFGTGVVGNVWRYASAKGYVTARISSTIVIVLLVENIPDPLPETSTPPLILSGTWSLDEPVTTVSGLWHLEGKTVNALLDGKVYNGYVVTNGAVTYPISFTRAIVGLGYRCHAIDLPVTDQNHVVEDRRKRVIGVAARVHESRGLKFGAGGPEDDPRLYDFKERTTELLGEPTRLQTKLAPLSVASLWDNEGRLHFVVEDPLPVTLLGYIKIVEEGDDDDSGQ